jgi:hypothetical protein
MKSPDFWDIMPYIPAKVKRPVRRKYRLHPHGASLSQLRNEKEAIRKHKICLLPALYLFLPWIILDPDDTANINLQNVG